MEKYCDNKSVGVVLVNEVGELALLERGRFPVGMAPPAGHIDTHGSPEQAAIDETYEEIGVMLAIDGLKRTVIHGRDVANVCRRVNGDHHEWTVYETRVNRVDLRPDDDETRGAAWYDRMSVQALAERTYAYRAGMISEQGWREQPGLEGVWADFLKELGYIE